MRYPTSEKLEIIRIVEQSHLPVTRTLDKLGIPKTTFYRWYDRYLALGEAGLKDRSPHPGKVWNRIPDEVRDRIVQLALDEPELSTCSALHRHEKVLCVRSFRLSYPQGA